MRPFTRAALERQGFVGWVPAHDARSADVPARPGVYVATYPVCDPTDYPAASCGGWFKGRNAAVSSAALAANWVEGAEVVYIGKSDNLRRRLRKFSDFGSGKPVGHWGGRLIWQLPAPADLCVAWKHTPARDPRAEEASLIDLFRATYGKPPFANFPNRLGR